MQNTSCKTSWVSLSYSVRSSCLWAHDWQASHWPTGSVLEMVYLLGSALMRQFEIAKLGRQKSGKILSIGGTKCCGTSEVLGSLLSIKNMAKDDFSDHIAFLGSSAVNFLCAAGPTNWHRQVLTPLPPDHLSAIRDIATPPYSP